ncbi:MAG: sugar-transfer associated ATP-grasp domain-containing protein [Bacteroidota bacterium]
MFPFTQKNIIPKGVLGINERNVSYVYKKNPRTHFPLADDKVLCKTELHRANISCPQTYTVIKRIGDIPACWEVASQFPKLAVKPANGSGGGGIIILKKTQDNKWLKGDKPISQKQIFTHMARILMGMYAFGSTDQVLIEACIEPHDFFSEIFPEGVPDFRVILVDNQPVMSMLRMPTERSEGKANLHQGGLGIGIDMAKGKLTQAYDGKQFYDVHPDNQFQISGKTIPFWDAIVDLAIQTSKAFPLNYLGVDIVLTAEGPVVLEINVRPGLGIQLANKQGLKNAISKLNQ